MPDQELLLPDMADELAQADAEAFLNAHRDVTSGQVDTDAIRNVPDGEYDVEILACGCRTATNKEGEVIYPSLAIRLRAPSFTATHYKATFSPKPNGAKFLTEQILIFFQKVLGPEFAGVSHPGPNGINYQSKIEYYNLLGVKAIGKKVRIYKGTDGDASKGEVLYPRVNVIHAL